MNKKIEKEKIPESGEKKRVFGKPDEQTVERKITKEQIRKQIEKDLEGGWYMKETGRKIIRKALEKNDFKTLNVNFFNNFHLRFNKEYREMMGEVDKMYQNPKEKPGDKEKSALRNKQTNAEFHEVLDKTAEECGFESEYVKKLAEDYYHRYGENKKHEEVWNVLIRIYMKMRERGYNNQDMVK
ncbi:hypothetical protein KAW38_01495 [Candidatus Micrarchaeota archaeon]|nr:hypothetical protein [Candidatus Micrarchaeota archaeon]